MDLLTTRPRHRRQQQQPTTQRRRPSSANSNIEGKSPTKRPPVERKSAPPKRVIEPQQSTKPQQIQPQQIQPQQIQPQQIQHQEIQHQQIQPQQILPRQIQPQQSRSQKPQPQSQQIQKQQKILIETKTISTQTEIVLIEKKLHDSLQQLLEQTLETIQKNIQKILDGKNKNIEESYAKLIEDIINKIDNKKHAKFNENKKILEVKVKDYKNHLKFKHKLEKEKEKEKTTKEVQKASRPEEEGNLKLKRQFSLEKLTKLSLGLKHSMQDGVETPKLKRQYSFEQVPNKYQDDNPKEDINELKSRLSKVMGHFKSTEMLNGHEEDLRKDEEINIDIPEPIITPEEEEEDHPPVASFPQQKLEITQTDTISLDDITIQDELISPPEDFQEHPYDSQREQELGYLKSLKEKLSSLVVGHRTSESSSEVTFHEKADGKKNVNDTKKIKELKVKLTQLVNSLKSPEKVDYDKVEKKLLKLKVKYLNVRFIEEEEFQTIKSEVIQLFNEAERIIEAGKHGLKYVEDTPRESVTSECSSFVSSEASNTESPYVKLERLKIMLEQMVSDIADAEILNYDLIFNELRKYQEEFSDIRTQQLPEAGPIRQDVFNLLLKAYNLLEDKNTK